MSFFERLLNVIVLPYSYWWLQHKTHPDQVKDDGSCNSENSDFFIPHEETILNNRYKLVRKLGGGVYSSTYLAVDQQLSPGAAGAYVAIKISTRDATEQHRNKTILESEIMRKIMENGGHELLPRLLDEFPVYENGVPVHHCIVMSLLGSDFAAFRRTSPTKALPPYTVRLVLAQIVKALVRVHELGIVHTDVKPDNILFHTLMSADDIAQWLRDDSAPRQLTESRPLPNRPEVTWNCDIRQAREIKVSLMDFGQAQWDRKNPTVNQFSAYSMRAPEVILQSEFTTAIDIWAVGCLAFEMLVGRWLFHPVDGGDDWRIEDDHLAKMVEFTGETFPSKMWSTECAKKYFDAEGKMWRVSEFFPVSIEAALRNYNILREEDIGPAADFICACIRLDPGERLTAQQLLQHSWLVDV